MGLKRNSRCDWSADFSLNLRGFTKIWLLPFSNYSFYMEYLHFQWLKKLCIWLNVSGEWSPVSSYPQRIRNSFYKPCKHLWAHWFHLTFKVSVQIKWSIWGMLNILMRNTNLLYKVQVKDFICQCCLYVFSIYLYILLMPCSKKQSNSYHYCKRIDYI